MEMLTRELQLDTAQADSESRRVPAVLSTTYPVKRDGFQEVLLHGKDNVDLSRAPLPLIESHNGQQLNIGLVENVRIAGGKLRGEIVFGSSTRANEVWPDVKAGIVRSLSVGYVIQDYRWRGETMEATHWQPYETSLVAVPADPNAGTYRSLSMSNSENILPANGAGERLSRRERREQRRTASGLDEGAAEERERVSNILAIGDSHGERFPKVLALAKRAVREGWELEVFREGAIKAMETPPYEVTAVDEHSYSGFRELGGRRFSVTRAIGGMLDPRAIDNGYEREVSQELARQMGRKPRGIYMPTGRLNQRALTVTGAPALVGEEHLGSEFIDGLRARSFVMQLGPRVLSGLTGDVSIPRLTGSATSGWIAGDGVDGLTETTPTMDSVQLTPRTVGAMVTLSRKMVLQGDPDGEQLIRDDFAKLIAVEIDRAAIAGSGASNQPTGVINTAGVTTGTYPVGGPDYASMLAMEAALMADNADMGSLAYLTTPALAAELKGEETATGSGIFVWAASRERGRGEMVGLPAYASSNVPLDNVVLGNWNDLLMGVWGAVDIDVNPFHDFAKGTIAVRVFASVDFGVRHPESFVVYSRGA